MTNVDINDELRLEENVIKTKILSSQHNLLPSANKIRVLHLNIRSVSKNFSQLLVFLQGLGSDFEILVLTEAWLQENDGSQYTIPGYETHYFYGIHNRADGVVIFTKITLNASTAPLAIINSNSAIIRFSNITQTYEIIAIYKSPNLSTNQFLESLNDYLESNRPTTNKTRILLGDLNIDILDSSEDRDKEEYLTIMNSKGFYSAINEITRKTANSGTCIDHIFTTDLSNNGTIIQSNITDHYITMLEIKLQNKEKQTDQPTQVRKTTDLPQLKLLMSNVNWDRLYKENNVNSITNIIIKTLKDNINIATTTKIINNKTKKLKPWITKGLITSIRKRDKMAEQLKLRRNQNNETLRDKYKAFRNKIVRLIRLAKTHYYKTKINEVGNNMKDMWKLIHASTNDTKQRGRINAIRGEDGSIIDSSEEKKMANTFNKHFVTIGSKLSRDILTPDTHINQKINNHSIFLKPIIEPETDKFINSLKNNSAPGPDGITSEHIKTVKPHILKPLTYLINKILSQGVFPDELKNTIVIPIHKDKDKTDVQNYRPISLTSQISKVVEKAIKERLTRFLEKTKFISKQQFGFREGLSTEDAMVTLLTPVHNFLDQGKKAAILFLDLKKAFDTCSHDVLKTKLENAGVRGVALNLFESYLTNRNQRTRIQETLSDPEIVKCGIPQGTVTSSIMFLIYINDICSMHQEGHFSIICFADDTAMIFHGTSWAEVELKMGLGIKQLKNALDEHKLSLNLEKTKYVAFSLTQPGQPENSYVTMHATDCCTPINCTCIKLHKVENIKYLGLTIDQHLKWGAHIRTLTKKIRRTFYKFLELRHILDKQAIKTVYSAIVQSLLQYGILIWGGANKTHLKPIITAQKTVIKIIFQKPRRFPSKEVYALLSVLSVRSLYSKHAIIYVHKHKQELSTNHSLNTRTRTNLQPPAVRTATAQSFILNNGTKAYNTLPSNIKNAPSITIFKGKLVKWLILLQNA